MSLGVVTSPTELLDSLDAAIAGLVEVPLGCLSPPVLGELVCELQARRAALDALMCAATAAADDAGVAATLEMKTIGAYVGARARVEPGGVAADRNLGRWLHGYPAFAEAFGDGRLSRRHVQVLRAAENRRTRPHLGDAQGYLIDAAERLGWREFNHVVRYWVLAADPDGEEPREQQAKRSFWTHTTADDMIEGHFALDPVTGAAVKTAIDIETRRILDDDAIDPDPPVRTSGQRRADALARLVARGAKNASGTIPTPLVHVVMSPGVADDTIARLAGIDGLPDRLPIDYDDVDARCELADGTPIHPHYATALLASAGLRRLVLDADSEILDLGRSRRDYPTHLKQAVIAAHRGQCANPGCDAPLTWLESDHHLPWLHGGTTATHNAKPRCRPHNRDKAAQIPDDLDELRPTPPQRE